LQFRLTGEYFIKITDQILFVEMITYSAPRRPALTWMSYRRIDGLCQSGISGLRALAQSPEKSVSQLDLCIIDGKRW